MGILNIGTYNSRSGKVNQRGLEEVSLRNRDGSVRKQESAPEKIDEFVSSQKRIKRNTVLGLIGAFAASCALPMFFRKTNPQLAKRLGGWESLMGLIFADWAILNHANNKMKKTERIL